MPPSGDAAEVTLVNAVRSTPPAVPAGPLLVCAHLEQRHIRVEFLDYQAYDGPAPGDPSAFAQWLSGSAPVLGIGVFSSSLPLVLAAAPRLKALRPGRLLVLGGPGTAGIEALLLHRCPSIDVVVHGEGEHAMADLVEAQRTGRSLDAVPGLSFRDHHGVHTSRPRPRNADLDRLAPPAYHLANLAPYLDPRWGERTPFGVLLARGCPFACVFCAVPGTWHGEVHARGADAVVDELRQLKERWGIDSFRILDDTFTLDRSRALRFCDRLAAAGLGLPWLCHSRVDRVDEPLIAALREAGCRLVFYGIESGSDRVLRRLGKTFSVARAFDVVEMSRRYVDVETSFMWGFPFESLDDLYDTLVAVLAMHDMGARPKLSWLVPFPAASLMQEFGTMVGRTLRHEVFPVTSHLDDYSYGPELLDIIRANRDILPNFFYLDYPGHDEKLAYLRRWAGQLEHASPALDSVTATRPARADRRDAGSGSADGSLLPPLASGISRRWVGGRRFVFDERRLRAFRPSAFGDAVLAGCAMGTRRGDLAARLMARHARGPLEVGTAIDTVLARLRAEGLVVQGAVAGATVNGEATAE